MTTVLVIKPCQAPKVCDRMVLSDIDIQPVHPCAGIDDVSKKMAGNRDRIFWHHADRVLFVHMALVRMHAIQWRNRCLCTDLSYSHGFKS